MIPFFVWNDGSSYQEIFKLEENFEKIFLKNEKEDLFRSLIKKYFLNNQHRLRVIQTTDKYFIEDQMKNETKMIQ